jgi:hypothetical protein
MDNKVNSQAVQGSRPDQPDQTNHQHPTNRARFLNVGSVHFE